MIENHSMQVSGGGGYALVWWTLILSAYFAMFWPGQHGLCDEIFIVYQPFIIPHYYYRIFVLHWSNFFSEYTIQFKYFSFFKYIY